MATTNPFASLGLSYMGSEQGTGEKIGEALKSFGTAYLLNASGLQGFMDKKKAESATSVPSAATIPGAVVPTQAPMQNQPLSAVIPPNTAFASPVANSLIQTTTLSPLATDDEGYDVLRSGMFQR